MECALYPNIPFLGVLTFLGLSLAKELPQKFREGASMRGALRKFVTNCAPRDENWTETLFSQTFRAPPGYPCTCPRDIPPKIWFPWISKDIPNFWPPPLHVPSRRYPDQKVWVWVPFSSLKFAHIAGISFCTSRKGPKVIVIHYGGGKTLRPQQKTMPGYLKHLVFLKTIPRKSPEIANYYGGSRLLRLSMF